MTTVLLLHSHLLTIYVYIDICINRFVNISILHPLSNIVACYNKATLFYIHIEYDSPFFVEQCIFVTKASKINGDECMLYIYDARETQNMQHPARACMHLHKTWRGI